MVGEAILHQCDDPARRSILLKMRRLGDEQIGLGRLPIIVVEVPLTADGRGAIHQETGLAAHVSVEVLHAQLLAILGPGGKFVGRVDEPGIGAHVDGQIQLV